MNNKFDLITIIGPTASGKTQFATALAYQLQSSIISGDSRQVYRGMDLGTGKDLADYSLNNTKIPYYLIDIVDAGSKYNVFEYQKDFLEIYNLLHSKGETPILCGGSGMYVESILKGYRLLPVPENPPLRSKLENNSLEELKELLATYKTLHNDTDVDTVKRAIRAIEIEFFYQQQPKEERTFPPINNLLIGVDIDREKRRSKIEQRLEARLKEGMIEEVESLLATGIPPENLIYYGLEYKFLTLYLIGQLSYEEMKTKLLIAIQQFAKRQMTWFRGMERRGFKIHWINAEIPTLEKVELIKKIIEE